MDVKKLRIGFIALLVIQYATVVKASRENDRAQDALTNFATIPSHRLKITAITLNAILDLQSQNNLSNEQARWLRDTWLY